MMTEREAVGRVRLKLETIMRERGVTRYALAKSTGISYPIIDNYYKNKVLRYDRDILARICDALDCTIADIIQYDREGGTERCS